MLKIITRLLGAIMLIMTIQVYAACEFSVEVGDNLEYSVGEMVAEKSCEAITVTLSHTGTMTKAAMGHNWVLAETENVKSIATTGMGAGLENNYLPPDDERILVATEIIGGGETTEVSFSPSELSADKEYTFFCTFPGHYTVMQGPFVLKEAK